VKRQGGEATRSCEEWKMYSEAWKVESSNKATVRGI
jgi:hypothetical protein